MENLIRLPSFPEAQALIRILLVDDHDAVRRGLRAMLESRPGWQVCGEASDGRTAVKMAAQLRPDIAVLDLELPALNGLEATRLIKKEHPEIEVLIYTMYDTEELIRKVLAAGARGYVLKSDAGEHLLDAVETLSHHKPFLTPVASETVLEGFLESRRREGQSILTNREREIVQLLAEAKANKEIAAALCISVKTVETHRATIMRKLGLNSIVELVHYAIRNSLVGIDVKVPKVD
jgi:DNA-binding NarL/FixJ family response regulator